ncbi:S24 family peptidase [Falsirhodobacter halotolerans]|uniref:S24 family peptidase n=1 Tax=Falsirhodobacter halotolerans TaxID=1146892 RepID=UPI001FD3EA5F|nr:S24 family peptidase [Falsirhodobacter halotolerans]MCJ8138414.1 hypothetical protein [Falsirhodobacter halotolerans]
MQETWHLRYLKHVMAATGLRASPLAKAAGLSTTTLTRPLSGADHAFDLSLPTLAKIEEFSGIPFAPFRDGEVPKSYEVGTAPLENTHNLVSVFDVHASAGDGHIVEDERIIEQLVFPAGYLHRITKTKAKDLAIIGVKGDSMLPTISDDDVVMIDMLKKDLSFDGLFVIKDGGASLLVKRIGRGTKSGHIMVISDNQTYPNTERAVEDIEVVGKVVWYGRKV